jgi:hypothetical protein
MKLISYGLVPQNNKKSLFPKRVRSVFTESEVKTGGVGFLLLVPPLLLRHPGALAILDAAESGAVVTSTKKGECPRFSPWETKHLVWNSRESFALSLYTERGAGREVGEGFTVIYFPQKKGSTPLFQGYSLFKLRYCFELSYIWPISPVFLFFQ